MVKLICENVDVEVIYLLALINNWDVRKQLIHAPVLTDQSSDDDDDDCFKSG